MNQRHRLLQAEAQAENLVEQLGITSLPINPIEIAEQHDISCKAEKVAKEEGTTLNQFINVAVAEKVAALRTARYFQERAARADLETFDRFLETAGDEPPRRGDEILPAEN